MFNNWNLIQANKTLERDQAYCAAFRECLVQENLHFYRSFLGLKPGPSAPRCASKRRRCFSNELIKGLIINKKPMIPFFKKTNTLKSYVLFLPRVLKKIYGKHKQYSEPQIVEAINQAKLNKDYLEYAFAIYMSVNSFKTIKSMENQNYQKLRKEVAKKYFKGNTHFTIHDIFSLAKLHVAKKKNGSFNPENISVSALGDPVQDFFDGD